MSAAVAEKPVEETIPPEWKMPAIRAGMEVFFYKLGQAVPKHPPEIAIVSKVWNKQIEIRTLSGMPLTSVRHLTDPLFERNPDLRKDSGAWDYTDEHVGRIKDTAELKSRLSTLEVHVAELMSTVASLKAELAKKK